MGKQAPEYTLHMLIIHRRIRLHTILVNLLSPLMFKNVKKLTICENHQPDPVLTLSHVTTSTVG